MAHTKLLFRSVGFKQTPFIDNKLMVWGLGSRTRHPYFIIQKFF
jgi:steroid 5-alpha reductase family enzyme